MQNLVFLLRPIHPSLELAPGGVTSRNLGGARCNIGALATAEPRNGTEERNLDGSTPEVGCSSQPLKRL